jgi:hypothetical protein
MRKVLEKRDLDDEIRRSLTARADTTDARVQRLLGADATASDPLSAVPRLKKTAYQHVISLIYECSANRLAAGALVERLLSRLSDEATQNVKPKAGDRRSKSGIHQKRRRKK